MSRRTLATTSLMLTLAVWGTVLGGFAYSHIAFFPSFLSDLPDSAVLVKGPYPVSDWLFWAMAHLALFLLLPATLGLNWDTAASRKSILTSIGVYLAAIAVTLAFFGPELLAFADSPSSTVDKAEWLARGERWQRLSWMRGGLMYVGFVPLLSALANKEEPHGG